MNMPTPKLEPWGARGAPRNSAGSQFLFFARAAEAPPLSGLTATVAARMLKEVPGQMPRG
jgi:hypothetical protein